MIYTTLAISSDNAIAFTNFWSKIYKDNDEKYDKLINEPSFNEDQIEMLFNWKNGMPIIVRDKGTGDVLKKHGNKAVFLDHVKKKLDAVNILKAEFDIEKFNTDFKGLGIWTMFLLHIIKPSVYPIFDQHVYRAYKFMEDGNIENFVELEKISNGDKMKIYKEEYIPFFNKFDKSLNNNRKLDKALWAFGKFLKSYHSLL